jgi:serine/threonine protein kinase
VAIKKLALHSPQDLAVVQNEMQTQIRLKAHPNVCQVLGWQHDTSRAVILLELMNLDLAGEIALRKKNEYPWKAEELWNYFAQLVDVFAYAQRLQISHRDIKPQNIFLTARKEIRVGDFGAAKQMKLELTSTLQGSPYYLSPELKAQFRCMYMTREVFEYNPYKADVYSLGLTFLQMITLETNNLFQNLELLQKNTALILSEARIAPFSELLTAMLEIDQNARPTFVELQEARLIQRLDLVQFEEPLEPVQEPHSQVAIGSTCGSCKQTIPAQPFPSSDNIRVYLCELCFAFYRDYQPLYFTEQYIWLSIQVLPSR